MRHLKPGKTRPPGPAVRRSRNAASPSPTATAPIRKHPRPKLATHTRTAGSANRPGTRVQSAWSTSGTLPTNGGRGPESSANAGTAASLPSLANRGARPAPRPTGSPAGAATPCGELRPKGNSPEKGRPHFNYCSVAMMTRGHGAEASSSGKIQSWADVVVAGHHRRQGGRFLDRCQGNSSRRRIGTQQVHLAETCA